SVSGSCRRSPRHQVFAKCRHVAGGGGAGQGAAALGHGQQTIAVAEQFRQPGSQVFGGQFPLGTNSAAPLSTSHWPLRVWWSSMAAGNGTSRAPTPAAVSSATVRAPARQTTKSAQP